MSPQWDWNDHTQEGTPFSDVEIGDIAKSLNSALTKEHLATKILLAEAGQYNFLYADHGKPGKGKQIDAFFNVGSPSYIAGLSNLAPIIEAHSYFTTSPFKTAISVRKNVAEHVSVIPGLKLWQSEFCVLGDNAGEITVQKRDLGMDASLYLANVIHNDLVIANASAWQWWLAISPNNYKMD